MDVKQTLAYRGLKASVIILGVLIVIALMVLVAGFAIKLGRHDPVRDAVATFVPPPDAKFVSSQASGDRLVLHLRSHAGEEIDIIDTSDGRLVARIRFASP